MKTPNHSIFSSPGWWIASAILLAVILFGCLGGHKFLLIVYEPAAGAINPLIPLLKEETTLRAEITELATRITAEKRRCVVQDCTEGRTPGNSRPPIAAASPDNPSHKNPAGTPMPGKNKKHLASVVFVLDCSVTMGLHVNTGPNVEHALIKGLKNDDPQAETKLQDFLKRTDTRRLDRAKAALIDTLNVMPGATAAGLVFTKDCGDTGVVSAVKPAAALVPHIRKLQYGGGKSLSLAFTKALGMIGSRGKNGSIIIITDGADSCDEDLCQRISGLNKKSAPEINLINMGRTEPFKCLSKNAFVKIYSPVTAKGFKETLIRVTNPTSTG